MSRFLSPWFDLTPDQVAALAKLVDMGLIVIRQVQGQPRARCVADMARLPAVPRGRRRPVTPRW